LHEKNPVQASSKRGEKNSFPKNSRGRGLVTKQVAHFDVGKEVRGEPERYSHKNEKKDPEKEGLQREEEKSFLGKYDDGDHPKGTEGNYLTR